MDEVVQPLAPKPPLALAHSMGGHILIRALHDHPQMFAAGIATAPMLRTLTRGYPRALARAVCYAENLAGQQSQFVFGMAARDPLKIAFEDNLVTTDRGRYARYAALVAAQSDLRLAGPTWGWLEAAYRSMRKVAASGYPEAIRNAAADPGRGARPHRRHTSHARIRATPAPRHLSRIRRFRTRNPDGKRFRAGEVLGGVRWVCRGVCVRQPPRPRINRFPQRALHLSPARGEEKFGTWHRFTNVRAKLSASLSPRGRGMQHSVIKFGRLR